MPLRYDINSPVLTAAEIFLGSQEAAAELGGSLENKSLTLLQAHSLLFSKGAVMKFGSKPTT